MPAPATGRALHIDQPLSNVLVGRRVEGGIADALIPITPVANRSDIYFKHRYLEWFRYEKGLTARAPGTAPKRVGYTVTSDTYYCNNYALGTSYPVEDLANADAILSIGERRAEFVTDMLQIDYEMRVADIAATNSNVGTVYQVSSAYNDADNSRPYSDLSDLIEAFRQRTGLTPNRMIIPQPVMTKLKRNTQFRDLIFGSNNGGLVTAQQIGGLLEIDQVLVPRMLVNTQQEYQTELGSGTLSVGWRNSIWLGRVNLLSGIETDTWINGFRWTDPLLGTPWAVQRLPYDPDTKTFKINIDYYQVEKVVSQDLMWRVDSVI